MKAWKGLFLSVASCVLVPSLAAQAIETMTLDQALARARTRAPQILSARGRVEEARGRLVGASVLLQENPTMDAFVGPRHSASGDTTDFDISVSQPIELGGRRGARIAGARAGVDRENANGRDVLRRLLRDVSVAFARGLAAKERFRLAEDSSKVADDLRHSMERRFEAGDVPVLDVNLARNGSARAGAEVRSARAAYISALGDIRILLGMTSDDRLELTGNLRDRKRFEHAELMARAVDRPDLNAIAAEKAEAQADVRLGRGFKWPTVAPAISYKREEGDRIIQGGVSLNLPVFGRGQELQAVGQAKANRLQQELDATQRAISVEVSTALDVYNLQVSAVEELERDALPSLQENESLARRSFEEGEIGLAELLLVRRDSFDLRAGYVERLLEAAIAGAEVEYRAGVLQ